MDGATRGAEGGAIRVNATRDGALAGWRLSVARGAWIAITLAATALYLIAIPSRFAQLITPCSAVVCAPGQITGGALSPATAGAVSLTAYAVWLIALDAVFAAFYVGLAWLIFWRRSADRMALFVSLALALWGLTFTTVINALALAHPSWFMSVASVRFLGAALITLFFFIFPDGRFTPRWARWLALIWIVTQVPTYYLPGDAYLVPQRWPAWLYIGVSAGFLGAMVALQTYRYRYALDVAQRRKAKWVVLGIALSLAGYVIVILLYPTLTPAPDTVSYILYVAAMNASLLLIPISIAIAILRDRLYDIDLLINRSLVYGTLSGALIAFYGASVYALSALARTFAGLQDNSVAVVVSTLGVVALFQPLRGRIQRVIDRRFYRRRYNAARVLQTFGETLSQEVEMSRLTERLVDVVERTMEPAHISLILTPRAVTPPPPR